LGIQQHSAANAFRRKGLVNWLTLKEAEEMTKKQPKPLLIDVYTDWCGWCKHMMKTTFSDKGIADYINKNFYPVRFNAETNDTIEFLGEKFINNGEGKRSANQLAVKLLDGKLSYPSIVYYNNNFKFKLIAPGYVAPKDIEPILVYVVEYVFNTTPIADFQKLFYTSFYPDTSTKIVKTEWTDINTALKNAEKSKKKLLVFINTQWCNSGKVMLGASFNDSVVATYINHNFHAVYFDAQTQDTVFYQNQSLNYESGNSAFHPFAHKLLGNQIILPSIVFLDHKGNVISYAPQFLSPASLEPVLHYFAEDKYTNTPWEEYRNAFKGNIK
jgi:thioredoxin-related protein